MDATDDTPCSSDTIETTRHHSPITALVISLLGLALSALVLAGLFYGALYVFKSSEPNGGHDFAGTLLTGDQMTLRIGEGKPKPHENSFRIEGFSPGGHDGMGRALLTGDVRLEASAHPILQYNISGRHSGHFIYLIWRTANDPDRIHNTMLYWSGGDIATFRLSGIKGWEGKIEEVGLDIYGDPMSPDLDVHIMAFLPGSPGNYLITTLSEWTAFRGWDQLSINKLETFRSDTILPLVPVAALWSLVAAMTSISLILIRYRSLEYFGVYTLVFCVLLPWICLDLLWENELRTQISQSKRSFEGLEHEQKFLTLEDRNIYEFIERVRMHLPDATSKDTRIFLLHQSTGHQFPRLRAQYYLLPYNVFNFGKAPPTRGARPGDYVIVLGKSPELTYKRANNTLFWMPGFEVDVLPIYAEAAGALFQLDSEVRTTR